MDTKLKTNTGNIEYDLLKININAHLNEYVKMLKEMEAELKQYINDDQPLAIIQLKQSHILKIQGKVEILTFLNNK